ncbi:6,7-dimethyl-8-ribityllumazine synthase [Marisediminicola sp. LYQ134]|uniref:6,7-dimethyl-8-ribityllumazine synthase n=1 Tax=unclassified Marisediminicola TaxID=2618316 RepID=UPI003983ACC6
MTGAGAPDTTPLDATGLSVTIVAGSWHETIAEGLLAGAKRYLEHANADVNVVRVSGSFELPVVSKAAFNAGADAVVALGVIIRGGTPHFEYVADATTSGLTQVSVHCGKPIGFGVLTVDTEQQGLDRAGLPESSEDKGAEAAEAAVSTALVIRSLAKLEFAKLEAAL